MTFLNSNLFQLENILELFHEHSLQFLKNFSFLIWIFRDFKKPSTDCFKVVSLKFEGFLLKKIHK